MNRIVCYAVSCTVWPRGKAGVPDFLFSYVLREAQLSVLKRVSQAF